MKLTLKGKEDLYPEEIVLKAGQVIQGEDYVYLVADVCGAPNSNRRIVRLIGDKVQLLDKEFSYKATLKEVMNVYPGIKPTRLIDGNYVEIVGSDATRIKPLF